MWLHVGWSDATSQGNVNVSGTIFQITRPSEFSNYECIRVHRRGTLTVSSSNMTLSPGAVAIPLPCDGESNSCRSLHNGVVIVHASEDGLRDGIIGPGMLQTHTGTDSPLVCTPLGDCHMCPDCGTNAVCVDGDHCQCLDGWGGPTCAQQCCSTWRAGRRCCAGCSSCPGMCGSCCGDSCCDGCLAQLCDSSC